MQFYLNGFRPGDPDVLDPHAEPARSGSTDSLPQTADVLIVGCGPAGLTLAAQLAAFPDIATCIVEQKSGPLEFGQADGVACRTVEMFNAFGFAERVLREAYWVNETTFWRPDTNGSGGDGGIARSGRIKDTEPGLSEFPHLILNQARVHEFFLDVMRKSAARLVPDYGRKLIDLTVDPADDAYPVTARFERTAPDGAAVVEVVRARYAVGCDGARSSVRRSIGQELKGDSASKAWGVMDVLAVTDFPDIRCKSVINSAEQGSIVLIPREGGYLARIYVEMDELEAGERVQARAITVDDVIAAATRVLRPYSFDVKQVAWWSVYEIGQRLCDRFDDVAADDVERRGPRVFIAGDACHTHSPKAGQGMNVSMQDAFNLGWKLAAVLENRAPATLLKTYNAERQAIARELIDFDREWAAMLSAPLKTSANSDGLDPAEVQDYFTRSGRYTAGTATRYAPSVLTGHGAHQDLASGFTIGKRFHSAPVLRWADAKPMHIGHVVKADGRWRLFAFADTTGLADPASRLARLCDFLAKDAASPLRRFTRPGADVDAAIDVNAVLQARDDLADPLTMPGLLRPAKGRLGLIDYEKLYCADPDAEDIFALRGIDRSSGCIVVVRPDQYVAQVLPLDAHAELADFFAGFMIDQS